jgi:hypothetical protein
MIVYNVTVKIHRDISEDWLSWMRIHHVPKVLASGAFQKCRLSKLDLEEEDGITYVLQYDAHSHEALRQYMIHQAPGLQKEHIERYANKFVAFRTTLEVIEELYPQKSKS